MRCPKCDEIMQKWFLIGGKIGWECTHCGYKENMK